MKDISLYIHIPFCKAKCSYCNFCVIPEFDSANEWKNYYTKALIKDIEKQKHFLISRKIKTIYIGWWTPSELWLENTRKLILYLQSALDLSNLEEFSIEINPDLDDDIIFYIENLQSMIKTRLRFSFGIQSLDNKVLKHAWRNYNRDYIYEFLDKIKKIKQNNNIYNLDFISFGIEDISIMNDFMSRYNSCIDSLSIYTLELFPGSVWHDTYQTNEDKIMENFDLYLELCKKYGYHRYEISNFAKIWKESIHNQVYWFWWEYIWLGISASSFVASSRYTNASNIQNYFKGKLQLSENLELSQKDLDIDLIFLGLRTRRGVDYKLVEKYSDTAKLQEYIDEKYLEIKRWKLIFTDKGFNLYNYIITELLEFD